MSAPATASVAEKAASPRTLFVLLDIDNTLYNYSDTGFGKEMHDRIFEFVEIKLGFSREQAAQKSVDYYHDYGLSLHGYVKDYHIDAKEYSDFVHQCSYDKLHYNAPLVAMLRRLQYSEPGTTTSTTTTTASGADPSPSGHHHLLYFTNANRAHARNVLTPLGLKDIFTRPRPAGSPVNEHHRAYDTEGFDEAIQWLGFSYEDQWRLTAPHNANKPMRAAYEGIYKAVDAWIAEDEALLSHTQGGDGQPSQEATAVTGSPISSVETAHRREHLRPENVVMVDDSLMNLVEPLQLGWKVVWFAHDQQKLPDASDAGKHGPLMAKALTDGRLKIIRDLLELEAAINELAQ